MLAIGRKVLDVSRNVVGVCKNVVGASRGNKTTSSYFQIAQLMFKHCLCPLVFVSFW